MISIQVESLHEAILACTAEVLRSGEEVSPRGISTLEIRPAVIIITDPRRRVVCSRERRVNPCFAAAETLWILSGSNAPWIIQYNKALQKFTNDGVLRGAYGPRIRNWNNQKDQLAWALSVLRHDPHSRRCVIQVYDPACVGLEDNDVPCTISFRFLVRNERLDMHTLMRANDVWLGMPYDIFCFTTIQEMIAFNLQCEIGRYVHMVDSIHIYRSDYDKARNFLTKSQPIEAELTVQHPIRIPFDQLDDELESVVTTGVSKHSYLNEHALLLNFYKDRRWPLIGLSTGLKRCVAIWANG